MKSDINTIEELMKILQEKKLTEISYETSEIKINIKGSLMTTNEPLVPKKTESKKESFEKLAETSKDIVSEHIGRYIYLKKDGTPIVKIGQKIEKGQELGNVVAVGVALPVVAKFSGKIEDIYIENGKPVDYGRPLIKVKIS
ncbi:Biotin carboxyl carrier protein of acetyl-CoA carboxylase [Fusobacterium necrogenes]|uniref:Biotin carboxyl carrier protein of acetyl-CoA carboxylase n=1 Tax=Fusobacterium necrogenes TaxID=858 RepID=A0A377GYM5_9FUSO|nr:biotin/lipoyl-containing protein [Fusobacterium necrogenes]STO32035.1 Biotin carboxyl carrier protein of acetyl-CoA carboxylase [Fusobacterium necrogenes]